MSPERRRLSHALLLSLLIHTLLFNLVFGGQGTGLPGFRFPWLDRRIEVPDLRLVLVPAQDTGAKSAVAPAAEPLPQAWVEQHVSGGPALTRSVPPVPASGRTAEAIVQEANPRAEAPRRTAAATGVVPAESPLRADRPGDTALSPVPGPDVIALAPSDEANWDVPAAPATPAPVIAADSGTSNPVSAMPLVRDAGDAAPARIDQEARERVVEPTKLDPSEQAGQRQAEQLEAARLDAARQEAARLEAERQETVRQEAAQQEAAQQEAARQEAARQEAARQEAARQEAARQEAARQEAARQEAARQEAARQVAARQEAARQVAARQEAARQEASRQEAARQEEAAREESTRQDAARQEAARQEAARQEAARQEAARQETARQETARQEAARQEAARQEAARQEAARQEAARQEAARQEAARQEAARQEAARHEAARQEEAGRREAVLRAIGRQLDEEAARREVASTAARQLPLSSGARRGRLFGRTDPNAELVLYAEAWSRKIELNMTIDMVREAAKQPHNTPLVTVAIRSDGSVESVTFVLSSGVAAIDEAIRRIIESQKPYQAFPPGLAREFDVIEIRRSWYFDVAIRLY